MTCGAADLTQPVMVVASTVCGVLNSVHEHQHRSGFTSKVWSIIYDITAVTMLVCKSVGPYVMTTCQQLVLSVHWSNDKLTVTDLECL